MTDNDKIIKQYEMFKGYASKNLKSGDIESSSKYCELSAHLGYIFNFRFCDDGLEQIVHDIGNLIIGQDSLKFIKIKKRIIFYDSFASSRVLTLQYLRAIFSWGFDVLYMTPKGSISDDVLYELNQYPNSTIFILPKSESFIFQVKECIRAIFNYKPEYVFLHLLPWDVLGVCVFNKVKSCTRFLINLTDHAFWLGKNCFDFIFEFRRYGCNISVNHRNIPISAILLQPYYPIIPNSVFQGFPIERGQKTFAFAGASFYKMYGSKGFFLSLIHLALVNNENLIFFVSGDGNDRPIRKFIKKNNLQKRLILLGYRSDINEVFKNIDIYVNTFPVGGGLMSQMAALNQKPIIAYSNIDSYNSNDIEDFLQIPRTNMLVRTSIGDFLEYFKQLVDNNDERLKNINMTKDSVVTPDKFNELLFENIRFRVPIKSQDLGACRVDTDAIFRLYKEIELDFVKSHKLVIWHTLRFLILKHHFTLALAVIWKKITSKMLEHVV